MTDLTADWSAVEVTSLTPRVATETSDRRMCADERKPRAVVLQDLPLGDPVVLIVALCTVGAELSAVNVLMTTSAPSGCERSDRPAIVVTTQALSGFVCAF